MQKINTYSELKEHNVIICNGGAFIYGIRDQRKIRTEESQELEETNIIKNVYSKVYYKNYWWKLRTYTEQKNFYKFN